MAEGKRYKLLIEVPEHIRKTIDQRREASSRAIVNNELCEVLEAHLNGNIIPFADEYDEEEKWATKEDIENWVQPVMDDIRTMAGLFQRLADLNNEVIQLVKNDVKEIRQLISE